MSCRRSKSKKDECLKRIIVAVYGSDNIFNSILYVNLPVSDKFKSDHDKGLKGMKNRKKQCRWNIAKKIQTKKNMENEMGNFPLD